MNINIHERDADASYTHPKGWLLKDYQGYQGYHGDQGYSEGYSKGLLEG